MIDFDIYSDSPSRSVKRRKMSLAYPASLIFQVCSKVVFPFSSTVELISGPVTGKIHTYILTYMYINRQSGEG